MKICSVCQYCYEDSAAVCSQENHGNLVAARFGARRIAAKYRLDVLLERNVAGEVYQASGVDDLSNSFLIRLIPLNLFGQAEHLHDRLSNVQAATIINHPNVASIIDYGVSDNNEFFIATEMVVGQTLHERLETDNSLSEATAIMIARQMAEGLGAAHAAGVIHRGINPANIILLPGDDNFPLIKIQNFDYGGIMQQIVTTNIAAAAPYLDILRYLSPEQCARNAVDARTDIYSLGTVLYQMLSGAAPFDAATPTEIVDKQISEQPLPLKELRFDVKALLTHLLIRTLNRNPASRPQTATGLARQLRHLEYITKKSIETLQNPAAKTVSSIKPIPELTNGAAKSESVVSKTDDSFVESHQPFVAPTDDVVATAKTIDFQLAEENGADNQSNEAALVLSAPIPVQKKANAVRFSSQPILVQKKGVRASELASKPILIKRKRNESVSSLTQSPILLPVDSHREAPALTTNFLEIKQTPGGNLKRKSFLTTAIGLIAVLAVTAIFGAILLNRQAEQSQAKESTIVLPSAVPVSGETQPASITDAVLATSANSELSETIVAPAAGRKPPLANSGRNDKNQAREEILTDNAKSDQTIAAEQKTNVEKALSAKVQPEALKQSARSEKSSNNDSQAELSASLDKLMVATNARDVDQQMNYYAPKVDAYYLARNASQATVRAEKKRVFANADVDIKAGRPEIVMSNDGQSAKMRFRKKYVIKKGQQNRSGEVIQELQWIKSGKDWKIVSERDVKIINR